MVRTRSGATSPGPQESRDASSNPLRSQQSAPAMQPSSAQQMQSMAAGMAELTRQNQDLQREINFRRQRQEAHGDEREQIREGERNLESESQSRGAASRRVPHLEKEVDQMRKVMDEMRESMRRTNPVEDLVHRTDSPFVSSINNHPLPPKFKMPTLDSYDGTRDPFDHIATFKTTMHLQGRHKRSSSSLLTIEQGENESLHSFITRFNREALSVDEVDNKLLLAAFHNGVNSDLFIHKLYEKEPQSMAELVHSAQNFMNAEDAIIVKKRKRAERMETNPTRHSEQGPRSKKGRTEDKRDREKRAGQSAKSKKAYLKVVQSVQLSGRSPCAGVTDEQAITFTDEDAERVHHPHDDAIVVTLLIADYKTRRVLIDNGSSADILYYSAFQQMRLGRDLLRPTSSPLVGFGGMKVQPVGSVSLPVTVGAYPQQVTKEVNFLVVDCSSSYNAIIGRPTLNRWKAITSTYHLSVKFPTEHGTGQVHGDQLAARECYLAMLAADEQVQAMIIEEKKVVAEPVEALEDIPLDDDNPERCTRVGADLEVKPVRQKKRVFAPERDNAIKEEVQKLIAAKFIRELVDSTAGHKLLSFLDAFSGYNQIRMDKADQEKTSFVTSQGLFCYEVMPFGLKNAGATYQRLVNHMFRPQIGRNMEVYIDDMLVKTQDEGRHLDDLHEAFETLRQYRMKLNPSKCAFGVSSGKFLGFMVSNRGIEANPDKIRAILNMKPPTNVKEVQSLTGRVAALNRFVSKATDKCLPFFKVLRKAFEWTDECQKAFEDLKTYLTEAPLLSPSVQGEQLYLYLAVTPHAVSSALVREEDKVQRPVYYTSKALRGAEGRYPLMEKLAFALITASRKLRHYFQAHVINVMTDHPLKKAMNKLEAAGRLIQWAVELSEFDIRYQPRHAIKAQALADFIAEFTSSGDEVSDKANARWVVYVDGSSTQHAGGIGVVLQSPEGDKLKHKVRLQYQTTNNEAEYEALLKGMELAKSIEAKSLLVLGDSQLIIGQVNGVFEAKEERMRKYLDRVMRIMKKFEEVSFVQVSREENMEADALAREASAKEATDELDEIQYMPSVDIPVILQVGDKGNWMTPIVSYLKDGQLPEERDEARKLRVRAARYILIDEILYKRGFSQPYLRCLAPDEANYVIREIHEGACGNHSGARSLVHKIVRAGYYWPNMQADAKAYVKVCDQCQRFSNIPRQPSEYLTPMTAPWPFAQWGLDILGPFPLGTRQMKFLVVGIDYFTKWVEAEPLANITQQNVKNFVWKNIVCRFGVPKVLVSDNGRQFDNALFKDFCTHFGIQNHYSSPAHPQANGQAEVANRSLTTARTPTGETPFKLAYEAEVVIPAEVHMASHRVATYQDEDNEE
nr:uncharacterized protein LOC112007641 [Quercus suber]